jgi:hypothetical protein
MTSGADPGALHLTVRLEVPPDLSSSVLSSAF